MGFFPFFLIIITGVLLSGLFQRFHLPWVLALIATGVVVGPQGFELVEMNPTISFIGEIGLIFLMFMAGLETKLSSFKEFGRGIAWVAIVNALVPMTIGIGIGLYFEFTFVASLLLGIIFMSSSIAVIVPTLESSGLINTKLGRSIVSTTIIEDVASLFVLSVLLQSINPITALPLPSFYFILILILIGFKYALPRIRDLLPHHRDEYDLFQSEVRIILALMLGTVVTFELLGLHPIIAGFFAGLVLSDSVKSEVLIEKLRTLAYGIFVPVFFVVVGMETDISVFKNAGPVLGMISVIVAGSMLSKFLSGWAGARFIGFGNKDSLVFGVSTMPQLSTTLAVAFTAIELGLLQSELATAMVFLSIVTTIVAPLLLRFMVEPKGAT